MKIRDIRYTNASLIRNFDCDIAKLSSIDNMEDGALGFCSDIGKINFYSSNNTLIVLDKKCVEAPLTTEKGNYIFSETPKITFVDIAYQILEQHPIEYVKRIGKNFKQGQNCVVDNCIIGDNVSIGNNVVIGGSGFGYVKFDGKILQFPHVGKVIIGDNVEIHSNVCIDRGALSNTIIGNRCKIDNLVHVAHNVEIGEGTFVIAQSMIGGSSKIGKWCWIGPGVDIINGITVADNTFLGMGTVVIKSIIPPNEVWVGVPARKLKVN